MNSPVISIRRLAALSGVHEATLRSKGVTPQMLKQPELVMLALKASAAGHTGSVPELIRFLSLRSEFTTDSWLITINGQNHIADSLIRAAVLIEANAQSAMLSPIGQWVNEVGSGIQRKGA